MLIKIGSSYLVPGEIAAAHHEPARAKDPEYIEVILRSGESVYVTCSAEEFEGELRCAGLLFDPANQAFGPLTKLGSSWVQISEISGAAWFPASEDVEENVYITLRSGVQFCVFCSQEEFEAAARESGCMSESPDDEA